MWGEIAGCYWSLGRDIIKPQNHILPASFNAHVVNDTEGIHQNLHLALQGRLTAAHEPNHITALKTVTG